MADIRSNFFSMYFWKDNFLNRDVKIRLSDLITFGPLNIFNTREVELSRLLLLCTSVEDPGPVVSEVICIVVSGSVIDLGSGSDVYQLKIT
jgi:hypothetical protein